MNHNIKELLNTVVENDYCIGCGICASLKGSPLEMKMDEYGKFKPYVQECIDETKMEIDVLSICPFTNQSKNETEIGEELFGKLSNATCNNYTGYYIKNYAGYVKEGKFREKGSSGGMGNWIVTQLLKDKLIDGVIHVKETNDVIEKKTLFKRKTIIHLN